MDHFCGSPFWDRNVTWDTDSPDFTFCFERVVLGLFPCVFLAIFTLLDLYLSYKSTLFKPIPWNFLNISKFITSELLILLEILLLVFYCDVLPKKDPEDIDVQPMNIYVSVIRAGCLFISTALLTYSKRRGVPSSGVQFGFWFFLAVTQAIRFRTVILTGHDTDLINPAVFGVEVVFFPLVLLQLIFHCWADSSVPYEEDDISPEEGNHGQGKVKKQKLCPENNASFLSRLTFEWYTKMAWKGYMKPLEQTDLWKLNIVDLSKTVVPIFDYYWPGNLNKSADLNCKCQLPTKKGATVKKAGILTTLFKSFGWNYMFGVSLRCVTDLLLFVSPVILDLLIKFVGDRTQPRWKGFLYAFTLFLTAFTGTLFSVSGTHKFYTTGMRIKAALTSAIFRKSLLLSSSAKRDESEGEIVNHMAVDVQYIVDFANYGYLLFISPVLIAMALYFLWTHLGFSAIAGLAAMFLLVPINGIIASFIRKLQSEQMINKDKRTKLMNEILSGMKVLKLYAWEPSFEKRVTEIRNKELRILRTIAYLNAISNFLSTCAPFIVAVCTFGTYVFSDDTHVLDAQTAFVSLALFNIMSQPLTYLPIVISGFIQTNVAFKRLNKFLNADEIDLSCVGHDENECDPIIIENGTFSWDSADNPEAATLKDINLRVSEGHLIAVVGKVGTGKSSLLSCLLNEMVKVTGRVNVRGKIAFVAQQAWIQNATLRENILFGKEYDPVRYQEVIGACALKPDFEMLPAGDQTEIGEKGINLSGGQKQRISLARSVYADADIYFFDDPLSAVDAHVGRHIFENVLGPQGILKKKTRLLVTHGVVYLPLMHSIVVMNDGKISESGSYQSLLRSEGAFSDFLKNHLTSEDIGGVEGTPIEKELASVVGDFTEIKQRRRYSEDEVSRVSFRSTRRRLDSTNSSGHSYNRYRRYSDAISIADSAIEAPIVTETVIENKLIETEKIETSNVKATVYLDYFRAAGWPACLATFGLYVVFQGFSVGANLWLSKWTNLEVVDGRQDQNEHKKYLGIYGALGGSQSISILIATIALAFGTVRSADLLHLTMLKRILRAPLSFFDVTPLGRIVNRFSKDVDSVDSILPIMLRYSLNGIFNVLAVLVVITISTPIFAAVIAPIGILYYFVQRFYIATSRQLKRLESVTRSPIYSHFGETVSGSSTIRAYNEQNRFVKESERRVDENMMPYFSSNCANRWLQMRLETVGNAVVFFAALFAVLGRDSLSEGLAGLSVTYALQITTALIMLVRVTSDVETNIVAVERLKEYSEAPQEAQWEIENKKLQPGWPQAGGIVFNGYQSRYRPGLDLVLRDVTCEINPGEKVGIVGRTGAGKSSMTLGLFRIVEAAGGSITIDGEDISKLGLHAVRGRITIIPQDPVLFSGTLRLNLDPFETVRDETLYRVLELSHLKSFVSTLAEGLDYEVVEGGENLSVGQRQLLCLARALLRKTKILVLDEATAAMDLETDDLIQNTIREEFKDCTVITIAHRINTIMDSDRVIVLDKGEIAEFDSPKNLLSNRNSMFYSMAKEAGQANN